MDNPEIQTTIIALSGRVGSGKSTLSNWLLGTSLSSLGIVAGGFSIVPEGLLISDIFGDKSKAGLFNPHIGTDDMNRFLAEHVNEFFMSFAWADELKRICVEMLGVDPRLIYGTQADKEEFTHLLWQNMPGVSTDEFNLSKYVIFHEPGPMTGREVQQFVGTEIFRRMYGRCHIDNIFRKIDHYKPMICTIDGTRFKNEIEAVKERNGITIRLTRTTEENEHRSENELNDSEFDYVIDNSDPKFSQHDLCQAFHNILEEEGLI